jgi:hypothetical protein
VANTLFPFIGAAYSARSGRLDVQRCVNLFPEVGTQGPEASKAVVALFGTPGLTRWATLAGNGVRGMLRVNSTLAVIVCGGNVYTADASGTATLRGTLPAAVTSVGIASNGVSVVIVDGTSTFYVLALTGLVLTPTTTAAYTGADTVQFLDGYFVFNKGGTGQFILSGLYRTAIDPLSFATAEGNPDNLVTLFVNHRELWLFGETTTEVWINTGAANFPLERNQGAFIETGCAAKFSPARASGTLYWLGADDRGTGVVYRANGYSPERVSTHAIEYALAKYPRIDDAIGYAYQQEGHSFYVLNFPSGNATWVYDETTQLWHERAWQNPATGLPNRHRGNCTMTFAGKTLVGDWQNGNVYVLSLDTYTDDGAPLIRTRQCGHLSSNLDIQRFASLQIDAQVGVGTATGQGVAPQAMLQWSDDGGQTWSAELWAPLGAAGKTLARARWRRLGQSRDRVFRVSVSDPVPVALVGAAVQLQESRS